jgi:DNA primase
MDLSQIKQLAILEVAVRLGVEVKGRKAICFGGHDTDPSLCFVPSKNIWKCFGCDKKGDAITLVTEVLGCDFKEALKWIEREFGVSVHEDDSVHGPCLGMTLKKWRGTSPQAVAKPHSLGEAFHADPQVYGGLIEKCGEVADARGTVYLRDHGIPLHVANRHNVRELRSPSRAFAHLVGEWGASRVLRSGLAWGDAAPEKLIWGSYSLLFPCLQNDEVIHIQGRLFAGRAKFIGLRGIAKPLYNADHLASLPLGSRVHLCEGIPDALALEAKGLHALAVLGASSFRPDWADRLLRYDVVVVPDGDSGGETFLRTVSKAFRARGKAVSAVRMPQGRDAANVLSEFGGDE